MWIWYALLSAFFASLTAILAKAGIRNVDADVATAIRAVVILVLTWCIVFFRAKVPAILQLNWQNSLFLVLSGLATGLSWLFYYKAMQLGNVSKVAPIDKISVVFTMILAVLFLKEQLSVKDLLGGLLIGAGALVMAA